MANKSPHTHTHTSFHQEMLKKLLDRTLNVTRINSYSLFSPAWNKFLSVQIHEILIFLIKSGSSSDMVMAYFH